MVGQLSTRDVVRAWWPLAASWLLMGAELPATSAVIARLHDAEVHLAAWGGVVFPVALLIEAPIIMMLAASTALCVDQAAKRKLLAFSTWSAVGLTVLHAVLAFTPLYDWLIVAAIDPPSEVVEPARWGLQIMTPWTWAIADRRFHQGLLIRFGQSHVVGRTTVIRLLASGSVLATGVILQTVPGIVVASTAICAGVIVEMIAVRIAVRGVLQGPLQDAPASAEPLSLRSLLSFYVPLALTPLLILCIHPIGAAAMSRMSQPLACLAIWPVFNGLTFLLRSVGMAANEVIVRFAEHNGPVLVRFVRWLGIATSGLLLVLAITPVGGLWFEHLSGLEPPLAELATTSLWLAVLLPMTTVWQSYYQGLLTHARRTRAITESVALHLSVTTAVLLLGVATDQWLGLRVTVAAVTAGALCQNWWLARAWHRLAPVPDQKAAPA